MYQRIVPFLKKKNVEFVKNMRKSFQYNLQKDHFAAKNLFTQGDPASSFLATDFLQNEGGNTNWNVLTR